MKQNKKQSKKTTIKKNNFQEFDIDITRYGLQKLAEALEDFSNMKLKDNEIVKAIIIGIPKITVLKFKIVSVKIPPQKTQDLCGKKLKATKTYL